MHNLKTEITGPVATVTLNRPHAMNALSKALRLELAATFRNLADSPEIRAIVLTGAGDRAFCAGLDLKELGSDASAIAAANATEAGDNPVVALEQCRKPVIGAINGVAITGGFELALACDVLIASVNARFADTHARVGILPGWGLSQKLSRLIGLYRAREMAFTGNFIDASTAASWGLVSRVVAADALLPEALKLANDMAGIEPATLLAYKRLIEEGFALPFRDAMALEQRVSTSFNASIPASDIESRREAVRTRGRHQTS